MDWSAVEQWTSGEENSSRKFFDAVAEWICGRPGPLLDSQPLHKNGVTRQHAKRVVQTQFMKALENPSSVTELDNKIFGEVWSRRKKELEDIFARREGDQLITGTRLVDFDWSARVVCCSEFISTSSGGLVVLELVLQDARTKNLTVEFLELNLEEMDQLIETFSEIEKAMNRSK